MNKTVHEGNNSLKTVWTKLASIPQRNKEIMVGTASINQPPVETSKAPKSHRKPARLRSETLRV